MHIKAFNRDRPKSRRRSSSTVPVPASRRLEEENDLHRTDRHTVKNAAKRSISLVVVEEKGLQTRRHWKEGGAEEMEDFKDSKETNGLLTKTSSFLFVFVSISKMRSRREISASRRRWRAIWRLMRAINTSTNYFGIMCAHSELFHLLLLRLLLSDRPLTIITTTKMKL